jgi:hypothetical protein
MMMCGGYSTNKHDDDGSVLALVQNHKNDLQTKLGKQVNDLEVKCYASQVVAGTNYRVHLLVNGETEVEVVIFRPLPCNGNVTQLTAFKHL